MSIVVWTIENKRKYVDTTIGYMLNGDIFCVLFIGMMFCFLFVSRVVIFSIMNSTSIACSFFFFFFSVFLPALSACSFAFSSFKKMTQYNSLWKRNWKRRKKHHAYIHKKKNFQQKWWMFFFLKSEIYSMISKWSQN